MEAIYGWFQEKPQRLIDSGRSLFMVGFVLLLVGLCGYMATTSVNVIVNLVPGAQIQPAKTLAEIYPTLPTWWVPESLLGFMLALVLIVLGIAVAMTGKQYKRMLG